MFPNIATDLHARVLFIAGDRRLCWPTSPADVLQQRFTCPLNAYSQCSPCKHDASMKSALTLATACQSQLHACMGCTDDLSVASRGWSDSALMSRFLQSYRANCESSKCCGCRCPAWRRASRQLQRGRPCGQPHAAEPPGAAAHEQGGLPECCGGRQAIAVAWQACAPAAILQGR